MYISDAKFSFSRSSRRGIGEHNLPGKVLSGPRTRCTRSLIGSLQVREKVGLRSLCLSSRTLARHAMPLLYQDIRIDRSLSRKEAKKWFAPMNLGMKYVRGLDVDILLPVKGKCGDAAYVASHILKSIPANSLTRFRSTSAQAVGERTLDVLLASQQALGSLSVSLSSVVVLSAFLERLAPLGPTLKELRIRLASKDVSELSIEALDVMSRLVRLKSLEIIHIKGRRGNNLPLSHRKLSLKTLRLNGHLASFALMDLSHLQNLTIERTYNQTLYDWLLEAAKAGNFRPQILEISSHQKHMRTVEHIISNIDNLRFLKLHYGSGTYGDHITPDLRCISRHAAHLEQLQIYFEPSEGIDDRPLALATLSGMADAMSSLQTFGWSLTRRSDQYTQTAMLSSCDDLVASLSQHMYSPPSDTLAASFFVHSARSALPHHGLASYNIRLIQRHRPCRPTESYRKRDLQAHVDARRSHNVPTNDRIWTRKVLHHASSAANSTR